MDATEGAFVRVKGDTALHQLRVQSVTLEILLAPGSRKESSFIARRLDLQRENSWQFGLFKYHNYRN